MLLLVLTSIQCVLLGSNTEQLLHYVCIFDSLAQKKKRYYLSFKLCEFILSYHPLHSRSPQHLLSQRGLVSSCLTLRFHFDTYTSHKFRRGLY